MRYRERLWPSPWVFVATALLVPAALVVFLPIDLRIGLGAAVVLYGGTIVVLLVTSPVIEVDGSELRAGRAHLPLGVVSGARAFRGPDVFLERGRNLDARAWTLFRGWIAPVVRIELDDPEDPTPYWLLSTRRPEEIVAAVTNRPASATSGRRAGTS